MKALHLLVLASVLSLGLGGCCTPTATSPQPPAISVNPPGTQKPGRGPTMVDVRLNHHCLPLSAIAKTSFTVDGVCHSFNQPLKLKAGEHRLLFPDLCMPGFVTPPCLLLTVSDSQRIQSAKHRGSPACAHAQIPVGGDNVIIVSYNRERPAPKGRVQAKTGHAKLASGANLLTGSPGWIVLQSCGYVGGSGNAYLDAIFTSDQCGLAGVAPATTPNWYVTTVPTVTHLIHCPPAGAGFSVAAGAPTIACSPISGYITPGPTQIATKKLYKSVVEIHYGQ